MAREYWKPGNMLNPLPAVMVSCQRPGEKPNIITLAWVGTVCSDPPMVSISIRPERYSYDIIAETKEFVINLVDEKHAKAMDWCGVKSGRDYDKFKEMHFTPLASKTVEAPGISECPVSLECKVKEILELGSHHMFVAEITAVSVDDAYMDETGRFNLNELSLISFSHGEYYATGKRVGKFGYSVEKKTLKKAAAKKPATKKKPAKTGKNA